MEFPVGSAQLWIKSKTPDQWMKIFQTFSSLHKFGKVNPEVEFTASLYLTVSGFVYCV